MARATWTNPLTWQEDEERGALVPVLVELTQGTSWWDATAVYIPFLDAWLMCWKYRWPPYDGPTLEWCTTSNGPEPPPPPGPGPAPPGFPGDYGDLVSMWGMPFAGSSCWDTGPVQDVPFEEIVGPWGGWECIVEGVGVGDMHLAVYPIAWTLTTVTWRYAWDVFGGSTGHVDVEQAPGFFPAAVLGVGEVTDCPGVQLWLQTFIPPP